MCCTTKQRRHLSPASPALPSQFIWVRYSARITPFTSPQIEAPTNPRGHSRQPIIASRERTVAIRDLVFCSVFLLFSLPPHHHHTTIGLLTHCWLFIVVLGCFVLYCSFILGGFCLLVLLFSQKITYASCKHGHIVGRSRSIFTSSQDESRFCMFCLKYFISFITTTFRQVTLHTLSNTACLSLPAIYTTKKYHRQVRCCRVLKPCHYSSIRQFRTIAGVEVVDAFHAFAVAVSFGRPETC